MEQKALVQLLEQLEQPAFVIKDGIITFGNRAYYALQVTPGSVTEHILLAQPERTEAQSVCCNIAGTGYTMKSIIAEEERICLLQPLVSPVSESALAHTSAALRRTMQQIYSSAELLNQQLPLEAPLLSSLLQGVFRLGRVADNIDYLQKLQSDAYLLKAERVDLTGFLSEQLDRAKSLLTSLKIPLHRKLPASAFLGNVDPKLLRLAVWNLLSSAVMLGCSEVSVTVDRPKLSQLLIKISAKRAAPLPTENAAVNLYEAPVWNVTESVDLQLVQAIARLHGGSLVITQDRDGELHAAATFMTDYPAVSRVHSDIIGFARSLDEGLIAFADLLPRSAYDPRDILG